MTELILGSIAVAGTLVGVWLGGALSRQLEHQRWHRDELRERRQLVAQFAGTAGAAFRTATIFGGLDRDRFAVLWQTVGKSLVDWDLGLDKDVGHLGLRIPSLAAEADHLATLTHHAVAIALWGGTPTLLASMAFAEARQRFAEGARRVLNLRPTDP